MHIVFFEDHLTGENRPITLTRPAFGVSFAATRLYDAAKRYASGISAIVRDYLRAKTDASFDLAPLAESEVLFLNASLAPSFALIEHLIEQAKEHKDFVAAKDSRVAAAYFESLPQGASEQTPETITDFLLKRRTWDLHEVLPLVEFPFDIIRCHQEFFDGNLKRLTEGLTEGQPGVFVGKNVKIHPTAVFDAHEGPILLHDNVSVGPFALIVGPVIVGPNSKIIERATIKEQVQIGHTCKIGGEVECAIIEPYSNKQHHGFLGHGYVGSWVNMGAGTCNSDLKNTYGEVTIQHRGRRINTEMQFLGCVIGDFSKTAINTSIFTGKLVGVCSFLYGFVGTNVPSFTNYARSFGQETEVLLDAAVKTQQRMFARRKVEQTEADVKLLEAMYEITRDERLMSTEALSF
ncbi:MAG: putative sugar nucleotidyl transferase [Planctomycetota bacterium]